MDMDERIRILQDKDYPNESKSSLICMLIHALDMASATCEAAKAVCKAAICAADEIMEKELKDVKDGK